MCTFASRIYSQGNTISSIDNITVHIDNCSGLLCFKYSDTVQRSNQFTTRELNFLYNTRKKPDTLKIIEIFRDSASLYNPVETRYYYINGKAIKIIVLRTDLVLEVTRTSIYFLNKSEIVEGEKIPNLPGWSHKQSSEHMYNVYKRFIKNYSDQQLPSCR